MLKISVIAFCAISMAGCANIASKKDGLAEQLNPKRIHGAFDENDPAFTAERIPVNDYYAAQKLAQKKYDLSPGQLPTEDAAAIKNYVYEGQCFQGDPDRLKAECSTDPNSTAR